jgi:hypothetical protein
MEFGFSFSCLDLFLENMVVTCHQKYVANKKKLKLKPMQRKISKPMQASRLQEENQGESNELVP